MRHILTIIFMMVLSAEVVADVRFIPSKAGDHYVFIPEGNAESVLVVAHGKVNKGEAPSDVAHRFSKRWVQHAQDHKAILIVPVFDTERFGNRKGGYGGYRNLLGKYARADRFVNHLVDHYAKKTLSRSNRFYLYGHSAGGQFVARYSVTHPARIKKGVISAAGRYSYPSKHSKWPYGAGSLQREIKWADGTLTSASFHPKLNSYAAAAEVLEVVVGGKDLRKQPDRPSHVGEHRVDFARSWAEAMNRNASKYGYDGNIKVHVVPGVGHDSARLTRKAVDILFADGVKPESNIDQAFAEALELEKRWERVISRVMENYFEFLGKKGAYENLSNESISSMQKDIRKELEARFSWSRLGDEYISRAMSYCDPWTLKEFAAVYKGADASRTRKKEISELYQTCGAEGIKSSMTVIQAAFKDAGPAVRKIVSSYRNK